MDDFVASVGVEPMPKEQRRQLFFIGLGMYGAVFFINVAFVATFESSPSEFALVRILAPALTVLFTIADTLLLRSVCKRQYSSYPDLLDRWPINVSEYPIWLYSAFLAMSCAGSAYLLSRI